MNLYEAFERNLVDEGKEFPLSDTAYITLLPVGGDKARRAFERMMEPYSPRLNAGGKLTEEENKSLNVRFYSEVIIKGWTGIKGRDGENIPVLGRERQEAPQRREARRLLRPHHPHGVQRRGLRGSACGGRRGKLLSFLRWSQPADFQKGRLAPPDSGRARDQDQDAGGSTRSSVRTSSGFGRRSPTSTIGVRSPVAGWGLRAAAQSPTPRSKPTAAQGYLLPRRARTAPPIHRRPRSRVDASTVGRS
jgi:hypothetical protein